MRGQQLLVIAAAVLVVAAVLFLSIRAPGEQGAPGGKESGRMAAAPRLSEEGSAGTSAAAALREPERPTLRTGVPMSAQAGSVVDTGGTPVEGVLVWFGEDERPTAVSGPGGRFAVPAWAATAVGPVVVSAWSEDYLPYEAPLSAAGAWRVVLDPGGVLEIQLVGGDGRPLRASATLELRSGNRSTEVQTAGSGFLRSAGWPYAQVQVLWNGTPLAVSEKLVPGEPVRLEVRLPRFQEGAVSGQVRAAGRPVAGARVSRARDVLATEPVLTDAEGWFSLPVLSPGRAVAVVEAEGYAPAARRIHARHTEGDPILIELVPGRDIPDQVLARAAKLPVAGADVVVRIPLDLAGEDLDSKGRQPRFTLVRRLVSDADGRFTSGPVPLENTVAFRANLDSRRSSVERREGGDAQEVVLWMDLGIEVTGQVVDPGGRPVPDAHIGLRRKYRRHRVGWNRNHWYVDEEGRFRIQVPAKFGQKFWLAVSAPGCLPVGEQVSGALPGAPQEITVILQPGSAGYLTGRVRDPEGNPVHKARVRARPAASEELWGTKTDPFGRFFFRNLPRGAYELSIDIPEEGKDAEPVMAATGSKGVELRLPGPRLLSGTLVPPPGWEGGELRADGLVLWPDHEKFFWINHPEGRFQFYAPPPGASYQLLISPHGLAPVLAGPYTAPREPGFEEIRIQLESGYRIEGRAVAPEGKDLEPGSLRVYAQFAFPGTSRGERGSDLSVTLQGGNGFVIEHAPIGALLRLDVQARTLSKEILVGASQQTVTGAGWIEVKTQVRGPRGDKIDRFETEGMLDEIGYLEFPGY